MENYLIDNVITKNSNQAALIRGHTLTLHVRNKVLVIICRNHLVDVV